METRITSKYLGLSCVAPILRFSLVASKLRTLVKLNYHSLIYSFHPRRDVMSYQAIKEYLIAILSRYQSSDRMEKSRLLNEAVLVTGRSRKQLIRLLGEPKDVIGRKKPSGRHRRYPRELLLPHIRRLWIAMERISSKRMKAAYVDWLPFYEHPEFNSQVQLLIEQMSASTLERFLRILRGELKANKGLSTTYPARYMKNKIPLNTFDRKITKPGFTQADTVAHCGNAVSGAFANTLTLTEIASTWTENRAIFTKKAHRVRDKFVDIKDSLPFHLFAINVDSGSEFLNNVMLQFTNLHPSAPIVLTRSRPYQKNDNCYVEQKNFTHVRELFGYERIEDPNLILLMNEIYKNYWNPLHNFFLPTFKLKEKVRIGAKIVKKFDRPQTPYLRLMNSQHLSEDQKQKLMERKSQLNPFELKAGLEQKLKLFFEELRKSKSREAA